MYNNSTPNVVRQNDYIRINRLDHPKCVSDFLKAIQWCKREGFKNITVENYADRIFPNACLPICGLIHYYMKNGINFNILDDEHLEKRGFMSPYYAGNQDGTYDPLDKIFRYDSSVQVAELTQRYLDTISRLVECEEGVLDGMSWCINEVMDNVLTHSECTEGYIMAQFHPTTNHIAFCIYDTGIGIFNSLNASDSKHHPRNEEDALSIAILEGISDGKGQGNGLYGLHRIIQENGGILGLTSGGSSIKVQGKGELEHFPHLPFISKQQAGTIVDFQINLKSAIDMESAFQTIGGYDGFDIRIDDMLSEEDEFIHYDILKHCEGTATRIAGTHLRNDIVNILKREHRAIILDFSNVQTVSSSFIDELIARMFISLGFILFNQVVRIKGMNDTVKRLCERSLYMRTHDEWERRTL